MLCQNYGSREGESEQCRCGMSKKGYQQQVGYGGSTIKRGDIEVKGGVAERELSQELDQGGRDAVKKRVQRQEGDQI